MTSPDDNQPTSQPVVLRYEAAPADRQRVRALAESTGFFSLSELAVAVELVDERLAKRDDSGYRFVFADAGTSEKLLGYACFGPIPATAASFDLYWIVVHRAHQRRGLGRLLLDEAERLIRTAGGRRVYVDTSNRPQYAPTRAFYQRCGYVCDAILKDFYAPGDDKVILVKVFNWNSG